MCGEGVCSILLLPIVVRCLRDNRCMYMAHVCFYVCCSNCVGVCGIVSSVAAVVKSSVVLEPWSVFSMLCVCVVDVMDLVFYVCILRRGAVGARSVSFSAYRCFFCLGLVCILWQFSMLRSA